MKQGIIKIFVLFGCVSIFGCASNITKQEFAPKMYNEHPVSILVLPPINNSTAADAKDYYLTTVAEPLTNCGYYVFPVDVVSEILKQEGLSDTETMLNVPPQKFNEFFGADAVMYVKILKWNTSYLVLSGSVTVQIECEMKSTKTGESLWYYNDEVSVSTEGNDAGAGGLAGLLIKAVTTAIKTAATDYVPLAMQANAQIDLALPYGKYHNNYDKDKEDKIVSKKKAVN
jgi:hypothetical protein